jgi:hypothetical protein
MKKQLFENKNFVCGPHGGVVVVRVSWYLDIPVM